MGLNFRDDGLVCFWTGGVLQNIKESEQLNCHWIPTTRSQEWENHCSSGKGDGIRSISPLLSQIFYQITWFLYHITFTFVGWDNYLTLEVYLFMQLVGKDWCLILLHLQSCLFSSLKLQPCCCFDPQLMWKHIDRHIRSQ